MSSIYLGNIVLFYTLYSSSLVPVPFSIFTHLPHLFIFPGLCYLSQFLYSLRIPTVHIKIAGDYLSKMTNSRAEQQVPVQIGSVLYLPTPRSPYPLFCQAPADAGCPVPCQLADKGYSHFVVVVGIYLMEDTDETYDKISFVQVHFSLFLT